MSLARIAIAPAGANAEIWRQTADHLMPLNACGVPVVATS
jgi:hypothetical protein